MSSYKQLYVHCVWATRDRLPLITSDIEPHIYASITAKCTSLGCPVLAIGGFDNHVHVLVQFQPTVSIAQLIGQMKGVSSHFVTHHFAPEKFFKWQRSYGVFTISKRSIPQVQQYIFEQKQHHADGTLIAELEQISTPEN